jgi:hypothetical protein
MLIRFTNKDKRHVLVMSACGRRPQELVVLLLGGSLFLCSAWFYLWPTRLEDYRSGFDYEDHSPLFWPKPAPWYPSLNRTHKALLAAHRNYKAKVRSPFCTAHHLMHLC